MKRLAAWFRSQPAEQPAPVAESVIKTLEHGFPHRPSCMSFSPDMRVLGIGNQAGEIKLLGRPGVEVVARHDPETSVQQILFLRRQLRLVTVGSDNDLHLWDIVEENGRSRLKEKNYYCLVYPSSKRVSVVCNPRDTGKLLVGTESGNVFFMELNTMSFSNRQTDIIFWNQATAPSQGTNKLHPGSVEALEDCPANPQKILIGYEKGTIVLWNIETNSAERNFPPIQYLGSATWHRDGHMFVSGLDDGSYAFWDAEEEERADHGECLKPYSTEQECKKIKKVVWKGTQENPVVVFEGGLPRMDYNDRFCVTIQRGTDLTAFDFTSKVVTFEVIDGEKEAEVLMVLLEEELVAIDLLSPGMPCITKPYLYSLHDSPPTCIQHVSGVPHSLWLEMQNAYARQIKGSTRAWPVDGGIAPNLEEKQEHDIVVTGHEDGSVRFWDASNSCFRLLYKLSTANLFANIDAPPDEDPEPEDSQRWPPFIKCGTFDPFSDDPRLAIMQVDLCPISRTLAVAGFGGQVITFDFSTEPSIAPVRSLRVEVKLEGEEGLISRKLGEMLEVKGGCLDLAVGFQASTCFVVLPPSPIVTLTMSSQWGIVAFGCRRGVVVADYFQAQQLAVYCTIDQDESRTTLSRLQSIRKSIRMTMRRLREGNRQVFVRGRRTDHGIQAGQGGGAGTGAVGVATAPAKSREKRETLEETLTRRAQLGNGVRCLNLSDTFPPGEVTHRPSVYCCMNSGKMFAYSIELPSDANRHQLPVNITKLSKEVELRHGAPILAFTILDHSGQLLPRSFEVDSNKAEPPDQRSPHYAVFCTEEQLKVITLPNMKNHSKYKVYDTDGCQLQRAGFMKLPGGEIVVGCTTTDGEVMVFSLPDLNLQIRTPTIREDDYRAQRTFTFSRTGEAFHMRSPCELQRFAITSAAKRERGGILTICESTAASPTTGTTPEAEQPQREVVEERTALASISSLIGSIFRKDKKSSPQVKKPSDGKQAEGRRESPAGKVTTDGEKGEHEPLSLTPTGPPRTFSQKGERTITPVLSDSQAGGRAEDFFAEEMHRAEEEQDFVTEILSDESFHTPMGEGQISQTSTTTEEMRRQLEMVAANDRSELSPNKQTATPEPAKTPTAPEPPKEREIVSSTKQRGKYGGSTTEKMLKQAIERHENLKKTEDTTKHMAEGAAAFAATMAAMNNPQPRKPRKKVG